MNILLVTIVVLIFVGFSIQNSFATNPEFVSVLPTDPLTQSLRSVSNAEHVSVKMEQVSINLDALKAEKINLSVFNNTIEITHDQTIFRNSTDYTFVGSTLNLEKNVFITIFDDKARLEISMAGENYVLMPTW